MDVKDSGAENSNLFDVIGAATSDRGAQMLEELLQLGIAISSEGDLYPLLQHIVTQARRFTGAEAATLFLREGSCLRFAVVQNEIAGRALGVQDKQQRLEAERLPLEVPSLAGHVAKACPGL